MLFWGRPALEPELGHDHGRSDGLVTGGPPRRMWPESRLQSPRVQTS